MRGTDSLGAPGITKGMSVISVFPAKSTVEFTS